MLSEGVIQGRTNKTMANKGQKDKKTNNDRQILHRKVKFKQHKPCKSKAAIVVAMLYS